MRELILGHETAIRLGVFGTILALMALWELAAPRREAPLPRSVRWPSNLGILLLNTLLLRLLLPAAAVGLALAAERAGWGLLHQIALPGWLGLALAVIALDLGIYLQHVMVHAVPLLWRLHRVHHADLHFDLTTGARFHPIEILLSMLIKLAAIGVIGPSPEAVVVFEVLLNATAMFNHGNVRIPIAIDRWLRWLIVTPDMHRVHHSVKDDETNSNFGFNLPWWDRLFGTYRDQPRRGQLGMTVGIHGFRDPRQVERLPGMLGLPFRGRVSDYAINRRQWARSETGDD